MPTGKGFTLKTERFGDTANPARQVTHLSQIRPGDILLRVQNGTGKIWHATVALESPNDMNSLHYTDSNHDGIVCWPEPDSPYSRENLDCFGCDGKACHSSLGYSYQPRCQMSLLYSSMVRSEEKKPALATFISAMRAQWAGSMA